GTGGLTPAAPAAFEARLWRRQGPTAKAPLGAPGAVPLLYPGENLGAGADHPSVRHRPRRTGDHPYEQRGAPPRVLGAAWQGGRRTGKPPLRLRRWAGLWAAWRRGSAAGTASWRLLVVPDCRGGARPRKVPDCTRRVLRDAGARSTAIWPDEAALSLWALPAD